MTYYKGDDYDAFDEEWALVEIDDLPEDWVVSRAELRVGDLPVMVFQDPVFPFPVNLASYQTSNLKDVNTCYMAIYDVKGRKKTLNGCWTFVAENEVV